MCVATDHLRVTLQRGLSFALATPLRSLRRTNAPTLRVRTPQYRTRSTTVAESEKKHRGRAYRQ